MTSCIAVFDPLTSNRTAGHEHKRQQRYKAKHLCYSAEH
jgi:hypothetical protein